MVDVVYILGKESRWNNTEIKCSIRSVEMYLKEYNNIYIIGELPDFFNDKVIHIPYQDIYGNKARNIMTKILRAANDERISKDFILFNDDYFLLKDTNAPNYPYYYKNNLKIALEKNLYNYEFLQHIQQTIVALSEYNYLLSNFDSHYPIVYNKELLKKVVNKYNWEIPFGLIMKSTYCNSLNIIGEYKEDCKINHPHTLDNWPNVTKELDMFSIGDRCINKSMQQYLDYLYPNKSKYEI